MDMTYWLGEAEGRVRKWGRGVARDGEADWSSGVSVCNRLVDVEGLLETAFAELDDVMRVLELPRGGGFTLEVCGDSELEGEAFELEFRRDGAELRAAGIEAARRGILYFCDRLLEADGPSGPCGVVRRKWFVRNRISRSMFGPIHRPPYNIDELANEIDYYPAPYLRRLAREGINILWLTVQFDELCESSLQPLPEGAERRLKKLADTVERCRRYGIRVFVFCIEPAGFVGSPALALEHPELVGVDWGYDMRCFCPGSETARRHLYELTRSLFRRIPHLGGIIDIPAGEALASCFGNGSSVRQEVAFECPRCRGKRPYQVLNESLEPMIRGMREGNPEAEFICWLYQSANDPVAAPWVRECAEHLPEGALFLYNFESGMRVRQGGKLISCGDYWMSQTGPSDRFAALADGSIRLGAKLQVSNSHELATVPVIPVPGTLYRKYRFLHEHKIDTVMYSWYFGASPGLMNRAAQRLSDETFPADEMSFLRELAAPWGGDADTVAEAWQLFGESFAHYPATNTFQYYGPAHDGVVWPLHFEATLEPLAPTWLPSESSGGDCIGECLRYFTLAEAEALCGKMASLWAKGMAKLAGIAPRHADDPERRTELIQAEAVGILFASAWHILRFNLLRRAWYDGDGTVIPAMRALVEAEIGNSERMLALVAEMPLLGYHAETENYRFDAARLTRRIAQLQTELARPLPERPSPPPLLHAEPLATGVWHTEPSYRYRVTQCDGELQVEFACDVPAGKDETPVDTLSIMVCDRLGSEFPLVVDFGPAGREDRNCVESFPTEFSRDGDGRWQGKITIPAGGGTRFNIVRFFQRDKALELETPGTVIPGNNYFRGHCLQRGARVLSAPDIV